VAAAGGEQFFKEMRAVRCIKFADEYGANTAEQCKQLCLDREDYCVGISFRSGSCKLISSFDCGGWQIYKRVDGDSAAPSAGAVPRSADRGGSAAAAPPSSPSFEAAESAAAVDGAPPAAGNDAQMFTGGDLNDYNPLMNQDVLIYFQKLDGNCRGGTYLVEMGGSVSECAARCHYMTNCHGFSYIKRDSRCTLKAESCYSPASTNPGVAFWQHIQRP